MRVPDRQLDLFAGAGNRPRLPAAPVERRRLPVTQLDDAALVAALPRVSLADCPALVAEAVRRKLAAAISALELLCRRFQGFGLERAIPEQIAALEALASIGGSAAAATVARLIIDRVVQGPGLAAALAAASRLAVGLPAEVVLRLMRDPAAAVRAGACGCARASPAVMPPLVELLADADRGVACEAALALGRMGRGEARPILKRLLREAPSPAVIDAVITVADEECLVILGQIARTRAELAEDALDALDSAASPRATAIAAAVRRRLSG